MASEESRTYVRRRKRGTAEQDDRIPCFQSRWAKCPGFKREKKRDLISEDEASERLINLELDAAEALAELWRMAREPSRQGMFDARLRWSCKRLRTSTFSKKDHITPCKPNEEPEDAVSSAKNRSSCISERDSMFSDREEIESTKMSKESSDCDLRAESPSSPLLLLQFPHGSSLPRGNPTAKSAFQRVLPMPSLQKPYVLPVKSEIRDKPLDGFDVSPQKASVLKDAGLPMNAREWKVAASSELLRTNSELCSISDSVVLSKPKPAFSEKEKETRKLLRVEANRESARQTIRRKQVACDELMKKASSLAAKNEDMKQKRDLLMEKLSYLRGENYHLKQQLGKEASGNLGLSSAEVPLMTLSESVSVPAFQVPSLPFAGFPVHALTWAMAATQANQAHTLYNKEKPLDAVHTHLFALQQWAAAMALPAIPPSKEAPVSRIVEPNPNHVMNGVCSPASMQRISQKETGCTKVECMESCLSQSEGVPCNPSSMTTVADQGLTDDLPEESACLPANCLSSQSSSPTRCSSSQASLTITPEIPAALDSREAYNKHAQTTHRLECGSLCGHTYDESTDEHIISGHSLRNGFRGRNHFAAVAAAEARKRRKELTRQKLSRSRAPRLVILAQNTKGN